MQVNMTWEQKRYASFIFPQIVQCDDIDIHRIHPLKQREACRIHEEFANNSDVESIYLFGSSVNIRCHIHSDTDVAVLLARDTLENRGYVSERIQELCNWNADVIWLNSEEPDSRLYREIHRGVRLKPGGKKRYMPEISSFFGIKVTMYYDDHNPPHFHVSYGEDKALIDINSAAVMNGHLQSKQLKLVLAWCVIHQEELLDNWRLAENGEELKRISPLM